MRLCLRLHTEYHSFIIPLHYYFLRLAVDKRYISHGTPVWLNLDGIQRMVIAQDKGGAIKGPIRGDLFWGTGEAAGELAGSMKAKGNYFVLIPVA